MQDNIMLFTDKTECCGCGACVNACPKHAIHMIADENGCMYPQIDREFCIACGKCLSVCNYKESKNRHPSKSYWIAIHRDQNIQKASTSGGFFPAVALFIIRSGGIVYGCAWDDRGNGLEAKHIRINTEEELTLLHGSKYVQSDLTDVYEQVKVDLQNGLFVAFSGTPCQIDGLYGYLNNKRFDKLITIEVICHGVPGSELFKDYLRVIEKKEKGKLLAISFRDKNNGGWCHGGTYEIRKDKVVRKKIYPNTSSFYHLFLNGTLSRINCYSCPYASAERCADFTMGDYWGIHKEDINTDLSSFRRAWGVSCVIANSEEAELLIHKLSDDLCLTQTSYEQMRIGNDHLMHPVKMNTKREEVMQLYRKDGYEAVDRWFNKHLGRKKIFYMIWNIVPTGMKRLLKK